MNLYISKNLNFLENIRWLPGVHKLILLNKQDKTFKKRAIAFCLLAGLGIVLGLLLASVPLLYLVFGLGGLIYVYLVFFKIEIAVIVYLLVQNQLGDYNDLGAGTAFHPAGLAGLALMAGTIYLFLFNKIDFSRLPVFKTFAGFFAVCLISLLFTGSYFRESLTITLRLGAGLAIYAVLLYRLDSIKKVKWVILAIILSQVWPTINAVLLTRSAEGDFRGTGTARLDTDGGGYLMMLLMLCLIHLLNAKTNLQRLVWGAPTFLFSIALFLSYSRTGWIAFAIALIIIGVLRHIRLLTIMPVMFIMLIVLVPAITVRFSDVNSNNLDDTEANTLAGRMVVWKGAIDVFQTRPVFGVGYGVGRHRVGEYLNARHDWAIHNDFLMVLLNTGLIGFMLFMMWHGQWLAGLLRVYGQATDDYDRIIAMTVYAIFVALLVARLTDNILQANPTSHPLFALVAAVLVLPRIRAEEAGFGR